MPLDAAAGMALWLPALTGLLGAAIGAAMAWLIVRGTSQATAQVIVEGQRAVGREIVEGHRAIAGDDARRERRARQVQGVLDLAQRRLAAYTRLRRAAGAFDGAQVEAVADQLHGEQTLVGDSTALGAITESFREAAEAFAQADTQCETAIKALLARGEMSGVSTTIGQALPALLASMEGLHRAAEEYIFGD